MDTRKAAAAVVERDTTKIDRLLSELRADPAMAVLDLTELAHASDPRVRDWVVQWAPNLVGHDAISILELLGEDSDSGVRSAALLALTKLNPTWARRLIPKYLRMLLSSEIQDVSQAIWRLTRFREPSAIAQIRALSQNANWSGTRIDATAALLVLEGREDELIANLQSHDHARSHIWMKALLYQGTAKAIGALTEFARNPPDADCGQRATALLAKADEVRPIVDN